MRKIFTERTLVVFLFIVALVVFSFASEDARSAEARSSAVSRIAIPAGSQVVDLPSSGSAAARD